MKIEAISKKNDKYNDRRHDGGREERNGRGRNQHPRRQPDEQRPVEEQRK